MILFAATVPKAWAVVALAAAAALAWLGLARRSPLAGNATMLVPASALAAAIGVFVFATGSSGEAGGPRGAAAPPPGASALVLGLGDSVAAGQGLGPATGYPNNPGAHAGVLGKRLGWRAENFAISGGCVATAGAPGAAEGTADTCTESILSDELPAAARTLQAPPGVVTIAVGANDIRFDECMISVVVPAVPDVVDPCAADLLDRHLAAFERNLATLAGALRERYAASKVVLLEYYLPIPDADGEPCPLYEPVALMRRPAAVVSPRALDNAVRTIQREVAERGGRMLARLNGAIAQAAAAHGWTTARVDFSGHDFCRTRTGGSVEDVWVWGPDIDVSVRVDGIPFLDEDKRWRFLLPEACPDTSADPPRFDATARPFTTTVGPATVRVSGYVAANCMPHPTAAGQEQIAAAMARATGYA